MEKGGMGRNGGVLRLPPGFRFHPTDEELVVQYLKRKALNYPLPAAIIPEIDLLKFNPWDLPGGSGEEKYYFNQNEAKYMSGSRANRATHAGYWKATGKEKQVSATNSKGNQVVVGVKRVLVFYHGRPPRGTRTDWVMHEYRLATGNDQKNSTSHNSVETNGWVLCRIFKKKRATKMDLESEPEPEIESEPVNQNRNFIDFLGPSGNNPLRSSSFSSDSSCVTEVLDESSKGEELTSQGQSLCLNSE